MKKFFMSFDPLTNIPLELVNLVIRYFVIGLKFTIQDLSREPVHPQVYFEFPATFLHWLVQHFQNKVKYLFYITQNLVVQRL